MNDYLSKIAIRSVPAGPANADLRRLTPVARPEASVAERIEPDVVSPTDEVPAEERRNQVAEPVANREEPAHQSGQKNASRSWFSEPSPFSASLEPSYFRRFSERSPVVTPNQQGSERKESDSVAQANSIRPVRSENAYETGRQHADFFPETPSSPEQKAGEIIVKEGTIPSEKRVTREKLDSPEKEGSPGVPDLFKSEPERRSTVQVRPMETDAAYSANSGKKPPAPAKLVIGRIVVEVVTPSPAVQTIRRPGPAPAGSAPQTGNGRTHKLSFGLGQL